MEKEYIYFKNILDECMDAVTQLKLKSRLLEGFKNSILLKSENLQTQLDDLRSALSLDDQTFVDKLNHIKHLQVTLGEKKLLIERLEIQLQSLNKKVSSFRQNQNDLFDDLPF